jgi:UDPglucose 6-dehydrogenase
LFDWPATKITFINEIADICEKVGGDVQAWQEIPSGRLRLWRLLLSQGYVRPTRCRAAASAAPVQTAQELGAPARIVEAVLAVNDARKLALAKDRSRVWQRKGQNHRGAGPDLQAQHR